MTPAQFADEIAAAARHAWDNVPAYLRQPGHGQRWGSTHVEFSDRRRA